MDEIRTIENYLGVHPDTELKEVLEARLEKLKGEKAEVKLKSRVVTATLIEADDFNAFVESKYGGSFEIVAIEELNNNMRWSFNVPNKAYMTKEDAEKIRSGNYPMWSTHMVVQCLYDDGYLEEGEYEIDVSW